jgi:cobalamin biosynthesis Mg chelatase CobN
MLFSFASVAVSLWLGLVAVACLHRLWRAAANDGSGYSHRDYPRAPGENRHRHRDPDSEGMIAIACRSLANAWRAIINVVRTRLSRAAGWVSRTFCFSKLFRRSAERLSPTPFGISNEMPGSQPVPPKSESSKTLPSNQSDGAARRKRATRISRQTAENRTESSQPRQRKMNKQAAGTASKLRKDHSEKKSRNMDNVATNTAKKAARTKTKISPRSSASLSPKISL